MMNDSRTYWLSQAISFSRVDGNMIRCTLAIPLVLLTAISFSPPATSGEREEAIAAIKELGGKIELEKDNTIRMIYLTGERHR